MRQHQNVVMQHQNNGNRQDNFVQMRPNYGPRRILRNPIRRQNMRGGRFVRVMLPDNIQQTIMKCISLGNFKFVLVIF